jgi:hypothetical protein
LAGCSAFGVSAVNARDWLKLEIPPRRRALAFENLINRLFVAAEGTRVNI